MATHVHRVIASTYKCYWILNKWGDLRLTVVIKQNKMSPARQCRCSQLKILLQDINKTIWTLFQMWFFSQNWHWQGIELNPGFTLALIYYISIRKNWTYLGLHSNSDRWHLQYEKKELRLRSHRLLGWPPYSRVVTPHSSLP